ncbi:sirohydrochlorin chelatase [Roseofilum casamattae]|uniref:Sirohydrochlorin chelatase n=1 Tax=Roseofilum casamattae BLCC-M143 TaxID=3022442 RepID=A0ABT7BU27_9CYAN|nr:sirohydrochlorin chelatase [Roseofilum casamattae]MDJ1182686.1 sirohydrochlorin chelatase [Roseofilum casamattae BLCC-M143]
MARPSAHLLVIHGSRAPRTHRGLWEVEQQVRWLLQQNSRCDLVATATLELGQFSLHEQIEHFGDRLLVRGIDTLNIIPLFLLPGVHVMEDIPAEVSVAQQTLGRKLNLNICPYLGTHRQLQDILVQEMAKSDRQTWIVAAHGSRRAGGNQPIEILAHQLGIVDAYWSVMPSVQWRMEQLLELGYDRIGILPYFLFPGHITDAIATAVCQLQQHYPQLDYAIAPTLSQYSSFAKIVLDLTVNLKIQR